MHGLEYVLTKHMLNEWVDYGKLGDESRLPRKFCKVVKELQEQNDFSAWAP